MNIMKRMNEFGMNDIVLISDKSCTRLIIKYSTNGDLYLSMTDSTFLSKDHNDSRSLLINKKDKKIYNVFDKLYNDILSSQYEDYESVDESKSIVFVSDEGIKELEDFFILSRENNETYKLLFIRNNLHNSQPSYRHKSSRSITIRVYTSGTKNNPYALNFLEMYQGLNKIENSRTLTNRKEDK